MRRTTTRDVLRCGSSSLFSIFLRFPFRGTIDRWYPCAFFLHCSRSRWSSILLKTTLLEKPSRRGRRRCYFLSLILLARKIENQPTATATATGPIYDFDCRLISSCCSFVTYRSVSSARKQSSATSVKTALSASPRTSLADAPESRRSKRILVA